VGTAALKAVAQVPDADSFAQALTARITIWIS